MEAVNKMQHERVKYDIILMDIIMPNLDGVSACHIIRQFDRTPIVAMTSNIRSDDIQMYFQHGWSEHGAWKPKLTLKAGMDDVLPKPFTRKSLLDMLEKHLTHLKAGALVIEPAPQSTVAPSSTSHSAVDGSSPGQSPAGSLGNWQSPSQFNGVSPIHTNMHNQYAPVQNPSPYLDQAGSSSAFHSPQTPSSSRMPSQQHPPSHRRQVSEMAGGPEVEGFSKRQRIHPPAMSGTMSARLQ
jgi:osomolarity two-component system response regulator SKN7